MKECPNCKELIGDSVSKCFECGFQFATEKEKKKFKCNSCNKVLPAKDSKCYSCGGHAICLEDEVDKMEKVMKEQENTITFQDFCDFAEMEMETFGSESEYHKEVASNKKFMQIEKMYFVYGIIFTAVISVLILLFNR